MSNLHKTRIATTRRGAEKAGEFVYKPCACDFGKDHDDFRSLSGQDKSVRLGTNDMLQVAKRNRWNFPPKELKYLQSWLMSGGEFEDGKLQPVPFADEILKLIEAKD